MSKFDSNIYKKIIWLDKNIFHWRDEAGLQDNFIMYYSYFLQGPWILKNFNSFSPLVLSTYHSWELLISHLHRPLNYSYIYLFFCFSQQFKYLFMFLRPKFNMDIVSYNGNDLISYLYSLKTNLFVSAWRRVSSKIMNMLIKFCDLSKLLWKIVALYLQIIFWVKWK